jgi:hypothetical protein
VRVPVISAPLLEIFGNIFPKNSFHGALITEWTSRMMDAALRKALSEPDIDEVLLKAAVHADTTMRQYIWRGFRPSRSGQMELMVGDKTAKDFVSEAAKRLCEGKRQYVATKTLLKNLNSVTDSLIWSDKKSSDRTGILDHAEKTSEDELPSDPITTAPASQPSASENLVKGEILQAQRQCIQVLRASFDGDKEMQDYLEALSEGYWKAADIAELMGIEVEKIYELRRKVTKYAPTFFGVKDYQNLALKIQEGRK